MADRKQSHITLMLGNVNEEKPVISTRRSWKRVCVLLSSNFYFFFLQEYFYTSGVERSFTVSEKSYLYTDCRIYIHSIFPTSTT